MPKSTRIERSWERTAKSAGIAAACVAVAALFVSVDGLIAFAVVALAPAAWFAYRAYAKSGIARCPGCGHELEELATGDNRAVLCPLCFKYVESRQGELTLTPEDFVAEH